MTKDDQAWVKNEIAKAVAAIPLAPGPTEVRDDGEVKAWVLGQIESVQESRHGAFVCPHCGTASDVTWYRRVKNRRPCTDCHHAMIFESRIPA
jgi:predicted RNA-binding Zn-ribbon protein involved in translation (DUF1610 family)